jgi:hypothetical protein
MRDVSGPATLDAPQATIAEFKRALPSTKGFAQSTCKHSLAQGEGGLSSWPNVACGSNGAEPVNPDGEVCPKLLQ